MDDSFEHKHKKLKQHKFFSALNFYIRSSIKEAGRRRLYFFLAVCSTLIVVCATAISQTVIDYAPLIFLKACESNSASVDLKLVPNELYTSMQDGINSRFEQKRLLLNATKIAQRVNHLYPDSSTARFDLPSTLNVAGSDHKCTSTANPPYSDCVKISGNLILQNTSKEAQIEMGRQLPLPTEIPEDYVILSTKQARTLRVQKGDTIVIEADLKEILKEVLIKYNHQLKNSEERFSVSSITSGKFLIPVKVYEIYESLTGKFTDEQFGNAIVYEYKHFFKTIVKNFSPNFIQNKNMEDFKRFLERERPEDYSEQIIFNLKNRNQVYLDSNFDNVQVSLVKFASVISKELGVFPYEMELPVYENLYPMRFGALFLGVSLKIIIAVLFLLSIIVIYNLLLVTVETKTFEFGVIRMLGLNKIGVAELILIQALFFVAPGLILGILSSIPLLELISSILQKKVHAEIPTFPTDSAIFWAIVVGLLIPIISSYYPMKEALGKNLNISLDLLRSKTNAIQIIIEMNIKKFPYTRVVFAILGIAFGLALYLLLPLSMLTFNLGLLLTMFFMILIGIFIGLALLSLNFQYVVERFVTQIFFFWTKESFRTLILKNLIAHKVRNRQTALMYSLSLGFIIFITVSLNQEVSNIAYQIQAFRGSLLTIWDSWGQNNGIVDNLIDEKLQGVVDSYAWMTVDLGDFLRDRNYKGVQISHKGKLYNVNGRILGVSPTIFEASLSQFLKLDHYDKETALSLGEQLYTARGSQSVILGEFYRENLGLTLDSTSTLMLTMSKGVHSRSEELRVLASVDFAPGFIFSQVPLVRNQDIIVSLPTFMRLAGEEIKSIEEIPLKKMFIRVKDDSQENMHIASEALTQLKWTKYQGMRVWDFADAENSLRSSQSAVTIIFVSVEIIVMILSLFSLITSMSTNILEQSKEIAVLRAVGVNIKTMNRLYVAEAFVLVFSSALFGAIIGAITGWTLSVQRVLFTQLPVAFVFPWRDLIIVFFCAIVSAIFSSYFPARRLTKMPIGKIIREGA